MYAGGSLRAGKPCSIRYEQRRNVFAIIGIVVVIRAILGGYLMEHGNLKVLMQPAELLIIGGAAVGTLLIANPLSTVMKIAKGLVGSGRTFTAFLWGSSV